MEFEFIRIDDRLIHGQVALGWSRAKGIGGIAAVDDETAQNSFRCSLLKMATPPGVKSVILTQKSFKDAYDKNKFSKRKYMLLVKNVFTLLDLVKMGIPIKKVNIGNSRNPNGEKVLEFVYLSQEEKEAYKELAQYGISFYAQSLPDQQSYDFDKIIQTF
ncbi:PTS system mannose/fructose/N-acetylgalactosamine-transporter subunit IIB [Faecalicoccus pleomorphus]|uniref:PTS system mannose/fructose/N-acetylgalactosamine-transporter subunit IIB n=1 Tax=Faecalicoccus pleomorphus TaxID=1323 RepID=UPI003DA2A679